MQLITPSSKTAANIRTRSFITLPNGLIGITYLKRFELVGEEESKPFLLLRSLDEEPIEFVVVEPAGLIPDYPLELTDDDASQLGISSESDNPLILNILMIKSLDPQEVVANLVAPLIVNRTTGEGRQVVLANYTRYSATHPLIGGGSR